LTFDFPSKTSSINNTDIHFSFPFHIQYGYSSPIFPIAAFDSNGIYLSCSLHLSLFSETMSHKANPKEQNQDIISHQANSNEQNHDAIFTVSTFRPSRKQELILSTLTLEQFKSHQHTDTFMYYSIPGVVQASYLGFPVNHSELMASMMNDDAAAGPLARNAIITRKTRISDGCDAVTAFVKAFAAMEHWQ
jgi:hypothetical protein